MGVNLKKVKKLQKEAAKKEASPHAVKTRYTVIKRGGKVVDVKLGFGKYAGLRITEMLHDPGAINYIKTFLLNPDSTFPPSFTKKVRHVFETNFNDFLEDDIPF